MPEATAAEARVRAAFRDQAEWCAKLGSPFTALVCATLAAHLDRSTAVGRRVLDWPGERPDARQTRRRAPAAPRP